MKSNFAIINRTQAKRLSDEAARQAAYQLRDEIHNAIEKDIMDQTIEKDIMDQTIATMLWTLHKHFGFGRARLLRVKNLLEDEYKLMCDGVLGREYNPRHCQEWLRSIGIDLDESQYQE